MIVDGATELLHRHEDDVDLASRVLAVLSDEALSQRLARAGRQLVTERSTMEQFLGGIAETYQSVLSPSERGPRF